MQTLGVHALGAALSGTLHCVWSPYRPRILLGQDDNILGTYRHIDFDKQRVQLLASMLVPQSAVLHAASWCQKDDLIALICIYCPVHRFIIFHCHGNQMAPSWVCHGNAVSFVDPRADKLLSDISCMYKWLYHQGVRSQRSLAHNGQPGFWLPSGDGIVAPCLVSVVDSDAYASADLTKLSVSDAASGCFHIDLQDLSISNAVSAGAEVYRVNVSPDGSQAAILWETDGSARAASNSTGCIIDLNNRKAAVILMMYISSGDKLCHWSPCSQYLAVFCQDNIHAKPALSIYSCRGVSHGRADIFLHVDLSDHSPIDPIWMDTFVVLDLYYHGSNLPCPTGGSLYGLVIAAQFLS